MKRRIIPIIILCVVVLTSVIIGINNYTPKSKAEATSKQIKVTYKSGNDENLEYSTNQTIVAQNTQGSNDYTNNKIVLLKNGSIGVNFNGGTTVVNNKTYQKVLTAWKLTSVTKNGTKYTEFKEPTNQNYADPSDCQKDIGKMYAQSGWYIVPDGVTEIELTAVYGRAIYARGPYDNMKYDEYHIYLSGTNNDGTTTEKSSDSNYGTSETDAVSTLKRAYELVNSDANATVYDNIIILCGNLYEINHVTTTKANNIALNRGGKNGTYKNYSSSNFGYNPNSNKPITIASKAGSKYTLYAISPSYDYQNPSSLRLDNINLYNLTTKMMQDVNGDSVTVNTYTRSRQFNFSKVGSTFETTETVSTNGNCQIRYKNSAYFRLNGGMWEPLWNYGVATSTIQTNGYIEIGGLARVTYVSIGACYNGSEKEYFETNPMALVIKGGKFTDGIYGTSKAPRGSINGNANIYVSGGYIPNLYGAGNGSVHTNGSENGDVNIKIYGGTIGTIYGAGQYYTSVVDGNVNIDIENANITGNIYGGGKGGKVTGDVNLSVDNTTIKGTVFGGGLGLTDQIQLTIASQTSSTSAEDAIARFNKYCTNTVKWEEATKGFPKYDSSKNQIVQRKWHTFSTPNGQFTLYENAKYASLTLATISGNVNLNINNSTIGSNVYGGGSIALVGGNAKVEVKNSSVSGNIYGGGDGASKPATVELYKPITGTYAPPASPAANSGRSNSDTNTKIGNFTWVDDEDILAYFKGIYDGKNRVIYNDDSTTTSFDTLGGSAQAVINKYGTQQLVYSSDAKKLGMIDGDVNLNVEGTTFGSKSVICGGGNLGKVSGNITENVSKINNSAVNVYGGGYKGNVSGDIILTIDSNTLNNIYGGGYSGVASGNVTLTINSNTLNDVYGGGYSGNILKNTTLNVNSNTINDIYGGGYSGDISGNTELNINGGTYEESYAGGYSGKVGGTATTVITSGTLKNVFGGGNLGTITKDTNVTIGVKDTTKVAESVTITGLAYGGGRGVDSDNDGDASDFTTVYGSSTVLIQGISTKVENYGSIKLGAVAGNVNVDFSNYWSGNSTVKYKTMNGIDRATTVSFDNSYVLLENKSVDNNGNEVLKGIQSIENLKIPSGSGLKISADGEITGNFTGGGELYLDSLVCLTVDGDIEGQTTLVLNPKLLENGTQAIRGGIEVPYLKVGGASPEATAILSGEPNKYVILEANKDTVKEKTGNEGYTYFYIAGDVEIKNSISVSSNSTDKRNYKDDVTETKSVYITTDGFFTSTLNVDYYLTNDAYASKDYTKITRKVKLISNSDNKKDVTIPVGTGICMINDGEFYYYVVKDENVTEIGLADFTKSDSSKTNYPEIKDIENSSKISKEINSLDGSTTYGFKEKYTFIFDFKNSSSDIDEDSYYPSINVFYGDTSFDNMISNLANNIVNIQNRNISYDLSSNRPDYLSNGNIDLSGKIKLEQLDKNTSNIENTINARIMITDSNGNKVEIPNGTKVEINNKNYEINDGEVKFVLLDNVNYSSISRDISINLDMKNVLNSNKLTSGTYKIDIDYLKKNQYENIVQKQITIDNENEKFGLKAEINEQDGISKDNIQLIEQGNETNRSIKITFLNDSNLTNLKIKVKSLERVREFQYEESKNSSKNIKFDSTEIDIGSQKNIEQNVNVQFGNGLKIGTYRILVELYNEYGEFITSDYVNIIVI